MKTRNIENFKQIELKKIPYNGEFFETLKSRLSFRSKYNRKTKKYKVSIPLAYRCHTKELKGNTLVFVYK